MVNYIDLKSSSRNVNSLKGNEIYQLNCASCHGDKRQGKFNANGDFFSSSLVGITFLRDSDTMTSIKKYQERHQGVTPSENIYKINEDNLKVIYNYLSEIDQIIDKEGSFGINGFWKELKDNKKCPG